ncbi:uncharacterized protein si:ch211-176l24.4 [Anguilla rostrata]|uniref:uncharacterized protein si:ch211-176l24.4 n=1 Tax=Anguilla rostrata TaxID=7938 RepID=UPI0030CC8E1F
MVSKKIKKKYSSSSLEEQQEWEEYLRRMCTSQTMENEVCCASETHYGDSVKGNKNKSKKLKSKEKEKHLSRKAEVLLCNDNAFEANLRRKKAKKLKKHKDKHQKQKNKDKSKLQDCCLLPLPVKLRKDKKTKSLGGSNQSNVSLLHQRAEALASQEIMFPESGRHGCGLFRQQHPVSEGSHLLKQEPAQAQSQIHPKSKNGAPRRKSVVFDSLPCSFECVCSQVKKQKGGTEHIQVPEPSPPGTCAKEMQPRSILVSRKAHVTFEDEDTALYPLRESDCKESEVTAENNSQELFITQKTFRPMESSSEESSSVIASFTKPRDGQCGILCPQLSQDLFLSKSTTEKATQTDDFFSSPALTPSLRFHKLRQKHECTERALDLSVPKRPHRQPTGSTDWQLEQQHEETNCYPLYPKLTSTGSNEQNRTHAVTKAGSAQLKVVQTRLNESFFFRAKGAVQSPKPQSPLLDHGMTRSKMAQLKMLMKTRRPSDLNSW